MGLVGKLLAIPVWRIRGLGLEGRWRMEMGMEMGKDRCGESRGMVRAVESVHRYIGLGKEWQLMNCRGLF
jgi:hypothetical protein